MAATDVTEETHRSVKKITWTWTSDASGDYSQQTAGSYSGEVLMLITNPDGTAAPADDYDVVINDEDGYDILVGQGVDRDTADTEYVIASMGAVANDKLTLVVDNAGNTKKGVVVLLLR